MRENSSRFRRGLTMAGLTVFAMLTMLTGLLGTAPEADAAPYCDGTHSPCYCPDDNSWSTNALRNCPRVLVGPQLPDANDGPSIWDNR